LSKKLTQGQLIVNALWAASIEGSIDRFAQFHTVSHQTPDGWACIVQLADVVGYKATSRMTEARSHAASKGMSITSRPCQNPTHHHSSRLFQHSLT
jgi:prophage antirepressor-like protein